VAGVAGYRQETATFSDQKVSKLTKAQVDTLRDIPLAERIALLEKAGKFFPEEIEEQKQFLQRNIGRVMIMD